MGLSMRLSRASSEERRGAPIVRVVVSRGGGVGSGTRGRV
jgi:hypothetical protein